MADRQIREILPMQGVWTIEDLAGYLEIDPATLQQALTDKGIKVLSFSSRYKHKLIRLEDLKAKVELGEQKGRVP